MITNEQYIVIQAQGEELLLLVISWRNILEWFFLIGGLYF